MDLISSDPTSVPSPSASTQAPPAPHQRAASPFSKPTAATTTADRKSKRSTLMQIQSDAVSAARAAVRIPHKQKKKPVSYAQLARSIHELAASSDQKKSQRQLVHHVFPKLAVYNSVDPSLAPSLLMLSQQCEDRTILRYVYYYLARILPDTGAQGLTPGGGIPTPNWDALADIDAVGGVTRADVVPRILDRLSTEALNPDPEFHARRLQALKALTYASNSPEILQKLYEVVFGILDKVADTPDKRKKGIFGAKGGDKEAPEAPSVKDKDKSSKARRPQLLIKLVMRRGGGDKGSNNHVRFRVQELRTLCIVGETGETFVVVNTEKIFVFVRTEGMKVVAVGFAGHHRHRLTFERQRRLHRRRISGLPVRLVNRLRRPLLLTGSLRGSTLMQIQSDAVSAARAAVRIPHKQKKKPVSYAQLARSIHELAASSDQKKSQRQLVHHVFPKLAVYNSVDPSLAPSLLMLSQQCEDRTILRYVYYYLARILPDTGAQGLTPGGGIPTPNWDALADIDAVGGVTRADVVPRILDRLSTEALNPDPEFHARRLQALKALTYASNSPEILQKLYEVVFGILDKVADTPDKRKKGIFGAKGGDKEATPDMAVTLLEIARVFATKVPGKIDADVLQLLWKTCLVGAGPDGKHTALEAVTVVLDLPPPQPGSMSGLTSIDRVFATDPKSALALQRLVQAAVWFLGENANYAASEYAWESATPPGTALMMLDADKMVAAASSRNPTLANALTRLQRCAFIGSWEVRIIAAQALTTMAIRSGEPYRIQIYEFLHALAQGGVQSQFSDMHISNGEDQGASGTGLGSLLSPMLKVLDDMYNAQDDLIKDMRNHDNAQKEWTDDELKKLYETHERLLDLVSLFCYVPRSKYLPLGPTSAKLIDIYRNRHNITASSGMKDPAVSTGISELIYEATKPAPVEPENLDDDLVNAWATGLADDGLWNNAPAMNRINEFLAGAGTDAPDVDDENIISRPSMSYDDMWAKTLLETAEADDDDGRSSGSSSPDSVGSVETSISSHFGGMNYPSLFSSKPSTYGSSQPVEKSSTSRHKKPSAGASSYEGYGSPIREEPPPYSSPVHQRYESFENPLAGQGSSSFDSHGEERSSSGNAQSGSALYDFTAGGDDELNLTAGEEVEIEYEVDGWFYVKKKRPGRDGKLAGLVPVLYVSQS
ncbi:hypothetical protein R6Q57_018157 [Mikania cordata]